MSVESGAAWRSHVARRTGRRVFALQWFADEGGAEADIAGATRPSCTLGDADAVKRIKVRGELQRRRRLQGGAASAKMAPGRAAAQFADA